MCGIYGILDTAGRPPASREVLSLMGRVIAHRGPDDEGQYIRGPIAFGMRRLSIIDVAGGHQPIPNENETLWVVVNGEIYNFQELRNDLQRRGHAFRSRSDAEVVLHLYEEQGLGFCKQLRGMFAIALWDAVSSRLVLVRDRLGKKPLYIRREPNRFLFASEIKALLQVEGVPRRLNPAALDEYLALGYVPAPATLFEGIEKVLPGHCLVIEKGQIQDHEYWDVCFNSVESRPEEEWVELVREKILESVRIRLVSEVPLGAFLSGGIDSSAVVAAMARLTNRPVKTYSIGFAGRDSYYNELPYAKVVAHAFATDHHEIVVRPEVSELLYKLAWHLDEPIADSASVTTFLVSRLARESVTVILSGVGGDELFGGYRRYLGENLRRYYRWLPGAVRRRVPTMLSWLPQDRSSHLKNFFRYASAFARTANWDAVSRYMSYVGVFTPEVRAALLRQPSGALKSDGPEPASRVLQHYFNRCESADPLNRIMYVDIKTSLADDLLALTDKASMAASIECRAPLVDHELIELTSRIPSFLKVRGTRLKFLLKKAVGPWLPQDILRRSKRGFGAPFGAWLRNDLDPLLQETLSEQQVRKRGLLHWPVLREIIISHQKQEKDHTDHLLALINLELWCRIFLDGSDWRHAPSDVAVHADVR